MAVVALATLDGNPQQLLRMYDQVTAKLLAAPPAGLISHTCVVLDDGIRIASVFESEEIARSFYATARFQDAVREAGMQPVKPQILQVHRHLVFQSTAIGR